MEDAGKCTVSLDENEVGALAKETLQWAVNLATEIHCGVDRFKWADVRDKTSRALDLIDKRIAMGGE